MIIQHMCANEGCSTVHTVGPLSEVTDMQRSKTSYKNKALEGLLCLIGFETIKSSRKIFAEVRS